MMLKLSTTVILLAATVAFNCIKSATADTIHIQEPASTELTAGQTVPISYEIHHNGISKLLWIKLHLMTENGRDAGPGVIDTMERSDWEDTLPVQIRASKGAIITRENNITPPVTRPVASAHWGKSSTKAKRSHFVQPEDELTRLNTKRFLYLISDQF
ncbi:hypothetical protein BGW42_000843 [Actinomortierella wolfii]|nr:hypothetical protein BGW42_000843 [Actinomortierella wolfii]